MTNPSHRAHKEKGKVSLGCGVVTASDTRTDETDTSGQLIRQLLEEAGHTAVAHHIVPDDPARIRPVVSQLLADERIAAVVINGGTGVARRDLTFDAVEAMLEKTLPGFGELFRYLSYEEIGSAAILSRATAGTVGDKVVFSIPGSRGAVRLAMERLILPEMGHIVTELRK